MVDKSESTGIPVLSREGSLEEVKLEDKSGMKSNQILLIRIDQLIDLSMILCLF
jgi:hypothetical protein